jgi:hypothetical protein
VPTSDLSSILAELPPGVWDLVPLAERLRDACQWDGHGPAAGTLGAAQALDTAKANFSIGLSHSLGRRPLDMANVILVLDAIRKEVGRGAPS